MASFLELIAPPEIKEKSLGRMKHIPFISKMELEGVYIRAHGGDRRMGRKESSALKAQPFCRIGGEKGR